MPIDDDLIDRNIRNMITYRTGREQLIRDASQVLECLDLIRLDEDGNKKIDPQTGEQITDEKRQAMYDLWIPKANSLLSRDAARNIVEEDESEP